MRIHPNRAAGFTLIEVMVAVIVLSVGLLGIARMQAFALSSTSVSSKRSIAAIQAASLAALMHENRGYWSVGDPANAVYTIKNGATSASTMINGVSVSWANAPVLSAAGSPTCTSSGACTTPAMVAAYDLNTWAGNLNAALPNAGAVIRCGSLTPMSCMLTISWAENAVAVNSQEAAQSQSVVGNAAATAGIQNPTFTVYIEP